MGLIKNFLPFLSGWKLYAWLIPSLLLALSAWSWYLHSSGHQAGYEKASLECAAEREAGKDAVIEELARLQAEALEIAKQNAALNRSINEEVRKESENVTERIETIVERQPIIVDPESCKRDYGVVELWNQLSRAGFTTSDSPTHSGSSVPE